MSRKQYWEEINKASEKVSSLMYSFWHEYSDWGNWQFWLILLFLLAPLVVLLIKLDRRKSLEILFLGYTVHMLWTYTDLALIRQGFLDHNYFLVPFLPQGLGITASFLPVAFMLAYQYCINHDKKFPVWALVLSAVIAFGFAPIEEAIGLLSTQKGFTIAYLFFIDFAISMIAYGMTKFFTQFYSARQ
ncbi:hypothetical protein [Neobacillus muris]|uniref:hypothetical protein n=1 Tax=Neobacillus muris TaxID=2941334 RepID=UPI00203C9E70|nr:hypothetical protein [Neobacillus muris]